MPELRPSPPARFQYSLATLLILMTIVAFALGFMGTTLGETIVLLVLWTLFSILPAVLVSVAVYARGDLQAFALGALVPMLPLAVNGSVFGSRSASILQGLMALVGVVVLGGVCGIAAAATRRLLRGLGRD